ncbi:hypothetical protein GCM10010429_33380 [Micromonospora olivasterospora]|uniref:Uncharacterized protein n=2 Tax=Micromonospora olivasterospora TaxID=1880 RepID=A0A562IA75_MICOL|nr:hypothetical protein JD77_02915 [Micromonospora olivasterospora]
MARRRNGRRVRQLLTEAGRPLRRSNFRRRVWLASLVGAGLLGQVVNTGPHRYRAVWPNREDEDEEGL